MSIPLCHFVNWSEGVDVRQILEYCLFVGWGILYNNLPSQFFSQTIHPILFTNDCNQFLSPSTRNRGAGKCYNLGHTVVCTGFWNLHGDSNSLVPEFPGKLNSKGLWVWLCFRQILQELLTLSSEIFRGRCYRTCNCSGRLLHWGL